MGLNNTAIPIGIGKDVSKQFQGVMPISHADHVQAEAVPNMPEGHDYGTAPSQHSAPAMPSEPPVTSPHRQLPGVGAPPSQRPPSMEATAAAPANGGAKENKVHNFFR